MSRNFDLASGPNYSINSVGSCGSLGNGAYTIIALFNINAGNNNCGLISFRTAGINAELFIDGNQIFGQNDFNGGQTGVTVSTWWWAAIRKAAGSSVYTYSLRQYNTGSTTHQNSVATHADSGATNTTIRLGDSDDRSNGLVAVLAAWTSRLSDAAVAGMFTTAAADVAAQSPQGLWLGNQASSSDPMNDSAGTANQTSVNGAIGVGSDPPAYDYSLSGAAVASARPPLVTSAPRPVVPGQQTLIRNTAALIVPPAKGSAPLVVARPGPVPAAAAILRRGTLIDPPVLTTRGPIVATSRTAAAVAAAILLAAPAAPAVQPAPSTPQPIVVTAPRPPAFSVPTLIRTAAAPPPSAQPVVVTASAASPGPVATLLRGSLADAPVLTTASPTVITAPGPAPAAAAILVRNPQAPAVQAAAATPQPIVVTGPAAAAAPEALLLRGSLSDAPVLTTRPPIVATPATSTRPGQTQLIRNPQAAAVQPTAATAGPLVIARPAQTARGTVILVASQLVPVTPGGTSSPTPEIITSSIGLDLTTVVTIRDLITRTAAGDLVTRTSSRDLEV